jgi:hypothetical protein
VTSEVPDYKANPARLAEQVAIPIVRQWLGSDGLLLDGSATSSPIDFVIDYLDGRHAVGDVWLDADETLMAVWGDLFKQERHQEIELDRGWGLWSLGLTHDANGRILRRDLPKLIGACLAINQTNLDFEHSWIPPEAPEALRDLYAHGGALGISYLIRHDTADQTESRDAAIYFPKSDPKPTGTEPANLREWINRVFTDRAGAKHIHEKLLPAMADERHAFVVAHTGTPASIQRRLATLRLNEPDLVVPDGITHVWVLPRYVEPATGPIAGLWTDTHGWHVINLADRPQPDSEG